jgi:hypothetical protein
MPKDPYIREKLSSIARRAVREYFKRYPKEQFQTELESWRYLPSQTIEFIMKRLREPVEAGVAGDGGLMIRFRCRAAASSSPSRTPAITSRSCRTPSTRPKNGRQQWKP